MTEKKKEDRIAACPLFRNLKEDDLEKALSFFHAGRKHFRKGESIKHPGRELGTFGLLLSGNVEVYLDDMDGNHLVMALVEEGSTFGESLCYLGKPNPVGIMALTDCEILLMDCKGLFGTGGGAHPLERELFHRFTGMLAERTLSMNRRIQNLSRPTIREKLMMFFAQQQNAVSGKTFEIPMDREHLAAYLGVNRSAMSRELSNMKKEGLIDYYKNSFRILK